MPRIGRFGKEKQATSGLQKCPQYRAGQQRLGEAVKTTAAEKQVREQLRPEAGICQCAEESLLVR